MRHRLIRDELQRSREPPGSTQRRHRRCAKKLRSIPERLQRVAGSRSERRGAHGACRGGAGRFKCDCHSIRDASKLFRIPWPPVRAAHHGLKDSHDWFGRRHFPSSDVHIRSAGNRNAAIGDPIAALRGRHRALGGVDRSGRDPYSSGPRLYKEGASCLHCSPYYRSRIQPLSI